MFWRLFLTFLILVTSAVFTVGLMVLQRESGRFWDQAKDIVTAGTIVVLASVPVAYFVARRFTRPLGELMDGARRVADGDFYHKIRAAGGGRSRRWPKPSTR
ncbi:HAMP domain-containing protein [Fimbriiglobus ruber]|uniref:HAMP domain-containing protein n=1 Tax=Fimbriiglobus ruber TaxID=1908690 RepID=A0A225E8Z0_9BACT|nr:HAMP domain-containing protein [Fimbriiglobus ruber]OWK46536.1 hypothetical protein FRUB_00235 [Fimbriiglobus ruber]